MHGNGAQWYIVDIYGNKVCIDTTTQYASAVNVPNYTGTPYTCHATADSLERFLMSSDGYIHNSEQRYDDAFRQVKNHVLAGNLVFTNGNHWYIHNGSNIVCYELGIRKDFVQVSCYDALATWKYGRGWNVSTNSGWRKVEITQSIKEYFRIA